MKRLISAVLALLLMFSLVPALAEDNAHIKGGVALYEAGDYANAIALFQQEADKGNTNAYEWLAFCYAQDSELQNYPLAMLYLGLAAGSGGAWATDRIGYCFMTGSGVEKDTQAGMYWFEKAVEMGYLNRTYILGTYYRYGTYGTVDAEKQMKYWTIAYENFVKDKEVSAENFPLEGMTESDIAELCTAVGDYAMAVAYYDAAFEKGVAKAAFDAANIYYTDGNGMTDAAKAVEYLEKYLETGDEAHRLTARQMCGWRCYYELGETEKGLEYLHQAAETRDASAMYFYATTLEKGEGDLEAAMPWYEAAAEGGNTYAIERLAQE